MASGNHVSLDQLEQKLGKVPDFPKPGIVFLDMSPVLAEPAYFFSLIAQLCEPVRSLKVEKIVAVESRGFVLGAAMAQVLGCGLVLVRKKGKLPPPTIKAAYTLEYGTDELEIGERSIAPGERVLIVDDVLATGGTAAATVGLCQKLDAAVVGLSFFIEIEFLNGRGKFDYPVHSLLVK